MKPKQLEFRDEWKCWEIPHGGDGGWRLRETDILGVRSITAAEAAETYAEGRMRCKSGEYHDGDYMLVGVEVSADESIAFHCSKRVKMSVEVVSAYWIKPEALVDGPKPAAIAATQANQH